MDDDFDSICSFRNLELAYRKARKGKRARSDVAAFEMDLEANLLALRRELLAGSYRPRPLRTFVIRDPKCRTISASAFRDRVVHHALCTIIAPRFERSFIHDSYANRKGFGTHRALARFDRFKRQTSRNRLSPHATRTSMASGFCLKADIRHYFATIDHRLLLAFTQRKVRDPRTLRLIETVLASASPSGRGLPLGNLTSQFFANAYLSQLDGFVKHRLRAAHYLRYVDDFVLLHHSGSRLRSWRACLEHFLPTLGLELHPEKSSVKPLHRGIPLLGFRMLPRTRLLKQSTIRAWQRRRAAGPVLEKTLQGWHAHARWAAADPIPTLAASRNTF